LQLARLYEAIENFPAAVREYRKLKDADPTNPILLVEFALGTMNQKKPTLEELGEVDDAVNKLRQVEPHSFCTAGPRAKYESVIGNPGKGVQIVRDFLGSLKQLEPADVVGDLLQQQKPAEALAALRDVLQKLDENDSHALREAVESLIRDHKPS